MRWWPRVNRVTLRADATAGLIGAIVVLPQGVAFATIAGMPPEYGLYAAIVPAIVAALFGSSWHLVSGPTTAISIVLYSTMSTLAEPGSPPYVQLVLMATFLTGVFQLAMGIARLGVLVNFISHTVVVGFTAGAGLLIAGTQIQYFFGIPMERGMSFLESIEAFITRFDTADLHVTAVGAATLLVGILVKRNYPRIPYMIAGLFAGAVFAAVLPYLPGLAPTQAIPTVTALPAALPQFSVPPFSLEALRKTFSIAVAVTMLGLTEAVSIARAIGLRSEQRIDGNQEFIGQGLSNVLGSFFSAYASSGSFNRSGLNYEAGAKTPLAAVFAALALMVVLIAVAPLASYLPIPAMAGILFLVAWGLIDWQAIRNIVRTSRSETAVLAVTMVATLTAQLEFAIYIGVLLSLMLYLNRTSRPRIVDVKPDPSEHGYLFTTQSGLPDCLQLKIVRINGSIFFGAVDHVQGVLQSIDALNPFAEARAHRRDRRQFHRYRRGRDARAGSEAAAPARRWAVSLPRERRGDESARSRRLSRGDREGEHLPGEGARRRLHLPAARCRDLPRLHEADLRRMQDHVAERRAARAAAGGRRGGACGVLSIGASAPRFHGPPPDAHLHADR